MVSLMKIREGFKGILCLPVTPLTKDDEIDEDALRSVVDIIIEEGADALVPTGATGEFAYLMHEERKKVQDIVLDQANGRVPVIAGTGATNTKEALIYTQYAKDIGCDGVLLSLPILLKAKDEQTYNYFEKIAPKVDIPIIVYNNPAINVSVSPQLVEKLATDFDTVVSYKEDDFNYHRFAEIIWRCKDKITIFSGSSYAILPFLVLGGHGGLVAEFQAFPDLVKGVIEAFNKNDLTKALEFHEKLMEIRIAVMTHFGNASFAARYKALLKLRGVDMELTVRHPHTPVTPEQLKNAESVFTRLGLQKVR